MTRAAPSSSTAPPPISYGRCSKGRRDSKLEMRMRKSEVQVQKSEVKMKWHRNNRTFSTAFLKPPRRVYNLSLTSETKTNAPRSHSSPRSAVYYVCRIRCSRSTRGLQQSPDESHQSLRQHLHARRRGRQYRRLNRRRWHRHRRRSIRSPLRQDSRRIKGNHRQAHPLRYQYSLPRGSHRRERALPERSSH